MPLGKQESGCAEKVLGALVDTMPNTMPWQQRKPTASWAVSTAAQMADQENWSSASAMHLLDHIYSSVSRKEEQVQQKAIKMVGACLSCEGKLK